MAKEEEGEGERRWSGYHSTGTQYTFSWRAPRYNTRYGNSHCTLDPAPPTFVPQDEEAGLRECVVEVNEGELQPFTTQFTMPGIYSNTHISTDT